MGRLTRNPDVRYTQGPNQTAIARYTLAVDRRSKKEGEEQTADFIGCVAFGKAAEFVEKWLKQGTKVVVTGRIQTGSYTNKDGQRVYTTDVVVEDHEFCESRNQNNDPYAPDAPQPDVNGFMNIPDGIEEELPFN